MRVNRARWACWLIIAATTVASGCTGNTRTPGVDAIAPCITASDCAAGEGCVDGGCAAGASSLLTVVIAGGGAGTVTSAPPGIDCGAACSATYSTGTRVSLTATPGAGSSLASWSGACTGEPCVVTVTDNVTATATFDANGSTADRVTNVVSSAGRVTTGTLTMDVQVGGAIAPQTAASGTLTLEAGSESHPGQQR